MPSAGGWRNCTRCKLHQHRRKIVLGSSLRIPRATVTGDCLDLLLIGEAPGKSEDTRGIPFCGPSGALLHKALSAAVRRAHPGRGITLYLTNTVACRPTDSRGGPNRRPTQAEVTACAPRVLDLVQTLTPRMIVFVGQVAAMHFRKHFPEARTIYHPAYVLRRGGRGSVEYLLLMRSLVEIIKELLHEVPDH